MSQIHILYIHTTDRQRQKNNEVDKAVPMSGWDADTHEDEIWRESLELLPVSNWHHLNATCCCATLVEIPATDHPADERPTSYSSQLYKQAMTDHDSDRQSERQVVHTHVPLFTKQYKLVPTQAGS